MDKSATKDLAYKIAQEHGYSLTQATRANRGTVLVADTYIDKWHFNNTKDIPYPGLEPGKIELEFIIDGGSDAHYKCPNSPANHSTVSIHVRLTEYKR